MSLGKHECGNGFPIERTVVSRGVIFSIPWKCFVCQKLGWGWSLFNIINIALPRFANCVCSQILFILELSVKKVFDTYLKILKNGILATFFNQSFRQVDVNFLADWLLNKGWFQYFQNFFSVSFYCMHFRRYWKSPLTSLF